VLEVIGADGKSDFFFHDKRRSADSSRVTAAQCPLIIWAKCVRYTESTSEVKTKIQKAAGRYEVSDDF